MFCNKFKAKLREVINQFDEYVEGHVTTALAITTKIKAFLSGPIADVITTLIPGDLDEAIRTKLLTALGDAIDALSIVDKCKAETTLEGKVTCWIEQLKLMDPALVDGLLIKLAGLLTSNLDDNKLQQSFYDLYVQTKFVSEK